jgi:hypothetical protein
MLVFALNCFALTPHQDIVFLIDLQPKARRVEMVRLVWKKETVLTDDSSRGEEYVFVLMQIGLDY